MKTISRPHAWCVSSSSSVEMRWTSMMKIKNCSIYFRYLYHAVNLRSALHIQCTFTSYIYKLSKIIEPSQDVFVSLLLMLLGVCFVMRYYLLCRTKLVSKCISKHRHRVTFTKVSLVTISPDFLYVLTCRTFTFWTYYARLNLITYYAGHVGHPKLIFPVSDVQCI